MRLNKKGTILTNECRAFTEYKVISDKLIRKKTAILSFCSLEAKPLVLDQIWGQISERA